MSLQLNPEQEQRIRTVVNAGAYRSAEEALDAAVAAVEIAAAPDLEGTQDELEELPLEVPDSLLSSTRELKKFFDCSYDYVSSLKPKPTRRKKLDSTV